MSIFECFFFPLGALEKESYVSSALLQVDFANTDPAFCCLSTYIVLHRQTSGLPD
jgi:hypothetical protein